MQQDMSEQLLMNYLPRTPNHNRLDNKITWAPKKEKHNCGKEDKFCRRCSPTGKECECSEAREKNAQRCLNFLENDKATETALDVEFTPYSSRTCCRETNFSSTNADSVENTKNIGERDFFPQLNSKRKLLYAKALQN